MIEVTRSEENYLKTIFHLEKKQTEEVSTTSIADEMKTKASSVTDMLKRLSEKELVTYIPYQGVRLTKQGERQALDIIRKHRLWEYFLVEKLNFAWDEVHDIAEQLEHIKSQQLINKLEEFLGFPKFDPHGDVIPDRFGNFEKPEQVLLKDCQVGDKGIFVGVEDSSKSFLQYLDNQQMVLGDRVEVVRQESFDDSLLILIGGVKKSISKKIAANIYIKPEP